MAEEPAIYRIEVPTIMSLIGDISFALRRLVELVEDENGEAEAED